MDDKLSKLMQPTRGSLALSKGREIFEQLTSELATLQLLMRQEMTDAEQLFWMEMLSPYEMSDIHEAFQRYVTGNNEFLPKPGQIIAIIENIRQERWRAKDAGETARNLEKWAAQRKADMEADPEGFMAAQKILHDKLDWFFKQKAMTPENAASAIDAQDVKS